MKGNVRRQRFAALAQEVQDARAAAIDVITLLTSARERANMSLDEAADLVEEAEEEGANSDPNDPQDGDTPPVAVYAEV